MSLEEVQVNLCPTWKDLDGVDGGVVGGGGVKRRVAFPARESTRGGG